MDIIWVLFRAFLDQIVFDTIGLIVVMFVVCMVLHRPGMGFKFFLFWLAVCAAVFYFVDPSAGIWGFLCYFIVIGEGSESSSSKKSSRSGSYDGYSSNSSSSRNTSSHSGSSYHPGGDVDYLPNGNSAVRYGDVTYMSNRIRSYKHGTVTYFFDDNTGKRLGRSVDNGNGVFYYYDDDGREIGHSYTSGDITDYFGDCFECR